MRRKLQSACPPVALFLFATTIFLLVRAPQAPSDYYRFWLAGELRDHTRISDIYAADNSSEIDSFIIGLSDPFAQKELIPITTQKSFSATPLLYLSFDLISTGSLARDTRNFRILSAILAALGMVVLLNLLNYSFSWSLGAILFFGLFFWPLQFDIRWGNTGLMQLGFFSILLIILKRNWIFLAGCFSAIFVLFKPTVVFVPLAFIALWTGEKQFRRVFIALAGMTSATLATWALTTSYWGEFCKWPQWHQAAYSNVMYGELLDKGFFIAKNNFIFHSSWMFYLTMLPLCVFSYLMGERKDSMVFVSVLALSVFLLCGPIIQMHYFVLSIPLILWLFRPAAQKVPIRMALVIAGTLMISIKGIEQFSIEWQVSLGAAILTLVALRDAFTSPTHALLTALSQSLRKEPGKIKTERDNGAP